MASSGNNHFLLCIGEKFKKVQIPGATVTQIFTESIEKLKRYVVITNEDELIIAYIDPDKNNLKIINSYPNRVQLNLKTPKLDVNLGGLLI